VPKEKTCKRKSRFGFIKKARCCQLTDVRKKPVGSRKRRCPGFWIETYREAPPDLFFKSQRQVFRGAVRVDISLGGLAILFEFQQKLSLVAPVDYLPC
jgi:hypothetical protein